MAPNLNDLCRLCGTDTLSIVRHLIFEAENESRCLAKKISDCLPVKVNEHDRLPKIMCGECAYKLDLLSEFRDKAVKTEHLLESLVDGVKPEVYNDDSDGDVCTEDFRLDSPEPAQSEASIKKEETALKKRPLRMATRKRPIREIVETDEESEEEDDDTEDEEEEEEEEIIKPPPKKRGRKPKEKTGECKHCNQRVADMDAHVVVHHPERVTCAVCGEICPGEKALRAHRRNEHSEKGAAGECRACGLHVKDLRRHTITKHTHDFPVACSECPKRFVSRSELNSHCRRAHGAQRKEMSLLCKYCGRSFSRKQYLVDHERKHRDERPFQCATCGNTYYSKVLLKSHQRVHASAGYSYECDLCHMKFTTQTGCKAHRKRHFAENRRFECLACGERFFKRATLDAHQISKHTHVKPFECALCAKRFPAKYDLQKHVETHIRVKSQVCEFCGAAYFRPDHLRRHKMQQHRELVPAYRFKVKKFTPVKLESESLNCKSCDFSCSNKRSLNAHVKKTHPPSRVSSNQDIPSVDTPLNNKISEQGKENEEGSYFGLPEIKLENQDAVPNEAKPMQEVSQTEENFEEHPLVVKGRFECTQCNRVFVNRGPWLLHMAKPHTFLCKTCKISYVSSRERFDHSCKFKCKECGKGLSSSALLKRHIRTHFTMPQFECDQCGMRFAAKQSLCNHIVKKGEHSSDESLWCAPCGKQFSTRVSLQHHTARKHVEGLFICSKCYKQFASKEERRTHSQQVHPKEKVLFDCPECGKKLSSRGSVQLHVQTVHKKHKPFLCQVCAQSYVNESQLRVHMTMHTGEKKYVCKVCGHAFARSENLNQHMRIHNNVRPFVCEFCAQSFRQQSSLKIHRRMHTGETPYPCHLCEKSFRSRALLNHHLKHHPLV